MSEGESIAGERTLRSACQSDGDTKELRGNQAMPIEPSSILLTDRVAVVTGAAQGIGRATALALARFGAHIALCDRDEPGLIATTEEIRAMDRLAFPGVLDVRDGEAVRLHIGQAAAAMGRIDILVNNAGGTFYADVLDVSEKGQNAVIHENFTSVTNFVRAVVPTMSKTGGSIVNVTSIETLQAAPGFGVYAAMKAAVASLTKTLSLELADRRIRVNSVAPDGIPTPGDAPLAEATEASMHFSAPPLPPLGYLADADACAGPIVFLCSDLSAFITGIAVSVDGGNAAAGGWRRTWSPSPDDAESTQPG
jgi:3-oxoacyl-[acyl-carrier protein] reductase